MVEERDELVEIDLEGTARPIGERASVRLLGRQGRLAVLPSPAHMLVLRKVPDLKDSEARACVLSGEIRAPGALCDIVGLIGHAGYRGELLVLSPAANRSVYFDQGYVIGAQSTALGERLGEVLYRYGVLDREQVARCSELMAAGALRFGEAAVRSGFVAREKLFAMGARQIEEIFHAALLEQSGMFYFLESYDEANLSIRHKLPVTTLVREGVRRMHETRYFRARIPSGEHVPVRVPGRPAPETDPLQIFPCIDDRRSVVEISRILGQGEFEVSRALFQLVQAEQVVIHPPRMTARTAAEVCNQAIALILREVDAIDQGDPIREQLGTFARNSEIYPTLFVEAGPADDGTLDGARMSQNVMRLSNAEEAEEKLARWLHDYVSYALFLARPHLDRHQGSEGSHGKPAPSSRLSEQVEAMLEPVTQAAGERLGDGWSGSVTIVGEPS